MESSTSFGAASQPPGAEVADACALLEDAEIEETLGFAVIAAESAFEAQCQWTLDDGGADLPTIFLELTTPGGRARWEILANQMPAVDVPGGEAYQQGDSVWAVNGDTMVKLSWFSGTVDEMLPLAEVVLSRIDG